MSLLNFWIYLAPPIAGGIIGYFTNDLAIKMLFRPYRPIYLGKRKLPFTPGLIPSNQSRLAQRVADTIMGSLLTPEELQNLARRLLQTERTQSAILWLLQLAVEQLKADKEEKTVKILAGILHDLLGQSLPRFIRVFARQPDFLEDQINHIFDRVLLDLKLNEEQARALSNWIFHVVLPANTIRQIIVDFLTDSNIQVIDEGFREKTSGTYWVVANLLGLKNALHRLRSYCLDEREQANQKIKDLLESLAVESQINQWLQTISLQNLPVLTVRQLRKNVRENIRLYLQEQGADLVEGLGQSIDWTNIARLILNRLQGSPIMQSSLEIVSQELALVLDRYLEKDLEQIIAQVIPILDIDRAIVDRVNATSPAQLELAINGIVRSELQAIVNLGGVLGTIVGCLQVIFLLLQ
ncbi:DUF445 domain-containing protein [Roseofilum casamattae]|uniref:DUF445 family protein n=1 Tax=Roseofilum casamattae BLCC-M143 TaxID=3022442 RepID=A0ABT7BRU5_9CYAN|nr:DUF445 family protein [Roseofilum casamattae]MDJ1181805.1 DUF445 family protein [Roseofilum casamattae BLCC-M143]